MTHEPTLLALDALAVARLTRLVTTDTITEPVRNWLAVIRPGRLAERPRVAEFLTCPWCISFWIAIGVVMLQTLAPSACLPISAVLAFSQVAGLLAAQA